MTTGQAAPPSTTPPQAPPRRRAPIGPILVLLLLIAGALWVTGVVPCSAVEAQPECWVAMLPGPTEHVDDLIEVTGTEAYGSDGELLLTTVLVDNRLSVRDYVEGLADGDVQLLRREDLYPPGRTVDDAALENDIMMSDSQLDAKVAALTELGIEFDDLPAGAEIVTVVDDSPAADTDLAAGDVIVAVDDQEVGNVDEAVDLLGAREPGDEVTLAVQRDGEDVTIELTLGENPDEPGRSFVGVLLRDYQVLPVDIDIDAGSIGGPSAGLVFTLGIIDRATAQDLTGGRNIAATGTIRSDGTVGPIGGIVQKIVGAVGSDDQAEVFLVPAGNWEAAQTASPGRPVTIVRVADLEEAVDALEVLADGREPASAVHLG